MLGNIVKIYNFSEVGLTMFSKGASVRLRSEPNTTSTILRTIANTGTPIGMSTGYYHNGADFYKWYEYRNGNETGWIRSDLVTLSSSGNTSSQNNTSKNDDVEAQQMMNEISTIDVETVNELNTCAALIEALKVKKKNTDAANREVQRIYESVAKRQADIESSATKSKWGKVTSSISTAASNAWKSLKNFFGFNGTQGVGIIITTTTLIIVGISILVGAGGSALIFIKPFKNAANIDKNAAKKIRKELEAAGLDQETINKVVDIASKEIVNAFTTGSNQGIFKSIMNVGKILLIGGVTLWAAPKVMDYLEKTKR